MGKFYSTKTFGHNLGLSCTFRQPLAACLPDGFDPVTGEQKYRKSACSFLHGYALQIKLILESSEINESNQLDERNWIVNFGNLKEFKEWLVDTFDHKTVIAQDDPDLEIFKMLHEKGIISLVVLEKVGCEAFAKACFDKVNEILDTQRKLGKLNNLTARVKSVEVAEHGANSAIYEADSSNYLHY